MGILFFSVDGRPTYTSERQKAGGPETSPPPCFGLASDQGVGSNHQECEVRLVGVMRALGDMPLEPATEPGIQDVSKAVAYEVEGEHEQEDRDSGGE